MTAADAASLIAAVASLIAALASMAAAVVSLFNHQRISTVEQKIERLVPNERERGQQQT